MEILHSYINGNVKVTLYTDGTKIQEWSDDELANPIFPNSMDIKITNFCDLNCKFCHEMSNINGKHGNLEFLKSILFNLPRGSELALGGGNPLDHPNLLNFLEWCKNRELVPNITINSKHLVKYIDLINKLIDEHFIYGVGLSISDNFDFKSIELINNPHNVVYHVIAGVNDVFILDNIIKSEIDKVLILGYKEVGRGITYKNSLVDNCIKDWFNLLPSYLGKLHLSFDNLAIAQLKVKRFFTQKTWKEFYTGTDGQFTMYIDAVNQTYSTSSTSKENFEINGSIDEIFKNIRNLNKFC